MASDHGELTRLTRGGHGMGGGFHSIKYVKADFFLLAKIEGRSLTGKAFVNARTSPPALTLEKTVTVPSHRLGGVRGGSATLKSLLHSGDSAMGRQPWEEIMPAAIGMALDLSNEQSRVESRLGTPRQGNRPLTPAQQRQGTPRGYTASGMREKPRGLGQSNLTISTGGDGVPLDALENAKDWMVRSQTSSIGQRAWDGKSWSVRSHRTGSIHGVIPRVLPDKLDYVLQARQRAEIQEELAKVAEHIPDYASAEARAAYKKLADSRLKPKLPLMPGLVHAFDPPLTLPSHNLHDYHSPRSVGAFRVPYAAARPSSLAGFETSPLVPNLTIRSRMSSPVSERMQLPTPTEIASRHAHGHVTPSESGTDRCLTERYLRALDIREL
eukprot:jgi/Chrpa1/12976/Chrysochromulina_OHIO_Genome00019935-RA